MKTLSVQSCNIAAVLLLAAGAMRLSAQSVSTPSPHSISFTIGVPREPVPAGEKLWISVTVKNLTSIEIPLPEWNVHIEKNAVEPPTTLRQRQVTGKMLPGEPDLRSGGFVPFIEPGGSFTQKTDATQLYDLSQPGKYTAYIELEDEVELKSGAWISASNRRVMRSSTASFEIKAAQEPEKQPQ